MTTLDTLRKEYDKLNPFERAVMCVDAAARRDTAAIGALTAPSLWDAAHTVGDSLTFASLAFIAVHGSMKGEILHWLMVARMGGMYLQADGEIEDSPEAHAQLDRLVDMSNEGKHSTHAWLMALEALDKETGGACMTTARIFAGGYIDAVMGRNAPEGLDYSAQLDFLRTHWNASVENSATAPKAKEPAAAEARQ